MGGYQGQQNFGQRGGGYGGRDGGRGGRDGGRGGRDGGRGGRDGGSRAPRGDPESSVFVGNLAYTATDSDLKTMFSGQGLNPAGVRVLQDDTGRSKGSAFVDFSSPEEAQRAIALDGRKIGNAERPLRINSANRR